jgi:hypothetical protein
VTLYEFVNECGIPIVLSNGTVLQPEESAQVLLQHRGETIIQFFVADAHGQPVGPSFRTVVMMSCLP